MNLSTDQLKSNGEAMIAFAEGRPIQHIAISETNTPREWTDTGKFPNWLMDHYAYRPKPKPKTRPWSGPDDVPGPVCFVRYATSNSHWQIISGADGDGVWILLGGPLNPVSRKVLYRVMAENWRCSTDRKTWLPCTVEVTEYRYDG